MQDSGGAPLDVIAWQPQSSRLGSWLGHAWGLGQESIYAPRLSDHGGLPVWREPLAWLRTNRRGVVLLRPGAAAHDLEAAAPLIAEDAAHGEELKQLLTRPAPRILVPTHKHQVAA